VVRGGQPLQHKAMAMEKPKKTARQLLDLKQHGAVIAVSPDSTVLAALKVMAEGNIGAVLVMQADRLLGVVSERDYARKVELFGRTASNTTVRDIMTAEVVSVAPDRSVQDCRKIMGDKRIRHLPVMDGERVVGVLSSRDVLDEVIAEDERVIKELEIERLISTTDPGTY
jgi:CBS domain-containing protein